jgi:hypothetical protein
MAAEQVQEITQHLVEEAEVKLECLLQERAAPEAEAEQV